MTPDEHQRERMRHWSRAFASTMQHRTFVDADIALAEFDKRFPAPSAAAPVEPNGQFFIPPAELAALRQKARLWDAVASGKCRLFHTRIERLPQFWVMHGKGFGGSTHKFPTAEEAVEAAIAAGALK